LKLLVRTREGRKEIEYDGPSLILNDEIEVSGMMVVIQLIHYTTGSKRSGYSGVEKSLFDEENSKPFVTPDLEV